MNFIEGLEFEKAEKAKKEFLQSGKTISELLKEKGYTTFGIRWIPPGLTWMEWITEETALIHIFYHWYDNVK